MKKKALGIMGGTFDPIHFGHLVAAEAVRSQFALEKVIFMPSGRPPHKKERAITAAEHRYLMTVLATINNPHFEVSRVELNREGYSYAIDTVRQVQDIYGTDTDIFFITGVDAILEILSWKKVDQLLDECKFVAATRPGYEKEDLSQALPPEVMDRLLTINVPALAISSTDIRKRVQEKKPIKYLVPEHVEDYIFKHKIYDDVSY